MLIRWKFTREGSPRDYINYFCNCVALLCLVRLPCAAASRFAGPSGRGPIEEHVCPTIDIRNMVSNLHILENCTVIEGNLQIVLMDKGNSTEFANWAFPKLREITGYLMLFRVMGLTSLKSLFPNLAVIRGAELFGNYAFVVYEMLELERIDLPSLTDIARGAVRIEKNPKLCYLNTIDWGPIARRAKKEEHIIENNGKNDECPDKCHDSCPKNSDNDQFCWNDVDCQKMCDASSCGNRTCAPDGTCCHESCMGGCWGGTQVDCYVCRMLRFNGTCMDNCPTKTYKYHNRRCLSDQECINMSRNHTSKAVFYKPFRGVCKADCPPNHMEDPENRYNCKPCQGQCPKECEGATISNIADAQAMHGCTRIKGSLQIQVSGGENVAKELEESLSQIREITGYLKVARSTPLKSLNFLKSLERIGSDENKLTEGGYALYVLDNNNLEDLWDWKNRSVNLNVTHGKIFFHFNPKLCVEKIRELESQMKRAPAESQDVSLSSNGDQVACNVSTMELIVHRISKTYIMIQFTDFQAEKKGEIDFRSLLGYMISYKEVPEGEVNLLDDYNTCAANSWMVIDVLANDELSKQLLSRGDNKTERQRNEKKYITYLVNNLKPYMRYAIYVKTYTIASEKHGGRSPVVYFRTKPTRPTPPVDVVADAQSLESFLVSWKPPAQPNGDVTHYKVTVQFEEYNSKVIYTRDYCSDPRKSATTETKTVPPVVREEVLEKNKTETETNLDSNCCPCPVLDMNLKVWEAQQKERIDFENFVHNRIFVKREETNTEGYKNNAIEKRSERKRRSLIETAHKYLPEANLMPSSNEASVFSSQLDELANSVKNSTVGIASDSNSSSGSIHLTTGNTSVIRKLTSVTISSLKHYSNYYIRVIACHDKSGNQDALCSQEAIISARTKPALGADDINQTSVNVTIPNKNINSVFVKWEPPPSPNGLILNFNVETRRADGSHNPSIVCVSYAEYLNGSGAVLPPLQYGNYSVRLQAVSMFGPGNWTSPCYFYIPEPSSNITPTVIGVIITCIIVGIVLIVGGAYFYVKKKYFNDNIPDTMQYTSVNPEYLSAIDVYVPDDWEIDREKISRLRELGQGSFGMVYEGEIKMSGDKPAQPCAIKTVNDSATLRERIEFLNEASVMKAFSCNHVVRLIGVVSKGYPTYVVMELMRNGDLKTFLRNHRPDQSNPAMHPPSVKRLLQMAIEIADGMAYLADNKYVHRDLAARNCMVSEDLTVKIGDFGMTRDIYETDYYRKGGKGLLPVRWMAPESLKDGVFTSQSDVWSYGVVLWEMATLASQPYQGLSNEQVLKYVIEGGVMEKPENCLAKLYDLMRHCWHYNPTSRPTFLQLIEGLLPEAHPGFLEVSFYYVAQERARGSKERTEVETDEEDGQEVSPSTPLRSPEDGRDVALRVDYTLGDEHEMDSRPKSHSKGWSARPMGSHPQTNVSHLNEGSKGLSISSSDGSKDSKTSTCSANGSIINGRVGMQWPKGMEC